MNEKKYFYSCHYDDFIKDCKTVEQRKTLDHLVFREKLEKLKEQRLNRIICAIISSVVLMTIFMFIS